MGCCLEGSGHQGCNQVYLTTLGQRYQETEGPGEDHACERGENMDVKVENPTFHLSLGSDRVYLFPGQRG